MPRPRAYRALAEPWQPPHPDRAWPILCKPLHKACEPLRSHGLLVGSLTMPFALLRGVSWSAETRTDETDSTLMLMRLLDRLWRDRPEPRCQILQVGVVRTRVALRAWHLLAAPEHPAYPSLRPACRPHRQSWRAAGV